MEHATWTVRVLIFAISFAVLYKIFAAKAGRKPFIRRLPGLEAVDEAVGRATELGHPILFSIGVAGLEAPTFAAISVLTSVTRKAAQYGKQVIVPIFRPETYPVVEELSRQAYQAEGRPDLFSTDNIRFLSDREDVWASAVAGIMTREEVAANFFFGTFGFEALIIAETGQNIGAIQIGATDYFYEVPFFIVTCDYTLIGEELYAASAYLSDDPVLRGSIVGQDIGKLIILILAIIGVIFACVPGPINWFAKLLSF